MRVCLHLLDGMIPDGLRAGLTHRHQPSDRLHVLVSTGWIAVEGQGVVGVGPLTAESVKRADTSRWLITRNLLEGCLQIGRRLRS